ncbi:hypothetical protein Scep_003076 [Stephania cephalantha]|uniref:FHA domain-containing protein n=1 Tax=Stephania cephalantha TaxID=152367 RepID=A0AAP0PU37_9MAGN
MTLVVLYPIPSIFKCSPHHIFYVPYDDDVIFHPLIGFSCVCLSREDMEAAAAAAAAALVLQPHNKTLSRRPLIGFYWSSSICTSTLSLKRRLKARQLNLMMRGGAVCFSSANSGDGRRLSPAAADTTSTHTWLLQPIGDGDSRHIGFKVAMPAAFEISSSVVIVGRLPEKADVVIPVATVSALHARIEKNKGRLLVTDLDSTNGTFIDDKRLRPGAPAAALPGNKITFGDTHLAIFLVSKLENVNLPSKPDESAASDEDNPKMVTEAAT